MCRVSQQTLKRQDTMPCRKPMTGKGDDLRHGCFVFSRQVVTGAGLHMGVQAAKQRGLTGMPNSPYEPVSTLQQERH